MQSLIMHVLWTGAVVDLFNIPTPLKAEEVAVAALRDSRVLYMHTGRWSVPSKPALPAHRCGSGTIHCRTQRLKVVCWVGKAPPAEFDFRGASRPSTDCFVQRHCPQLQPLVEQGVLLVVSRPGDYVERRKDGYQEPEHVVLVGTAHVSQKSADAVTQVIQALEPDSVVVELCRSRSAVLQGGPAGEHDRAQHGTLREVSSPPQQQSSKPNPLGLSGGSLREALMRSVRLGGGTQVLIRAIMAGQVRKATASIGLATGAEMQAARAAAEQVGANIVLGDRPIEMTLQRAWQALTWRQKARLGWEGLKLGVSNLQVDEETVENLKDDDTVASFEAALSQEFPKLAGPLLHERDAYLAWCLRRSKAVNHAGIVVGVMGFGHLRGVTYHLLQDGQQLRFKDLVGLTQDQKQQQGLDWGQLLFTWAGILSGVWWAVATFWHPQ